MMVEETFVMVKPDGVRLHLIGEVIKRFEMKQLEIVALKMVSISRETAEELYEMHKGKSFFEKLISFTMSGPAVVMVVRGEDAVMNSRIIVGDTYPEKRVPGSIRGDFSPFLTENIVHASSSEEDAKREIKIFFD
ncbi:MAG: nucleoside-diphosphate kinase [Caldisericaceae bacterium]